MINRRNFVQRLLASGTGSLLAGTTWARSRSFFVPTSTEPVAVATWNNQPGITEAGRILAEGGRALDAIESGIRIVEANPDDPSVGYGGLPDREGNVTLDACIMDEGGNAGSVTYLQHIMHPISVARKIMEETPHVMLSGKGALGFALDQGFRRENLLTPQSRRAYRNWRQEHRDKAEFVQPGTHDTVGMLALDQHGNLSGGCSTSGWAYKMAGRVGDSPIIGAGLFIDNEIGAATATGLGELVMKTMGAFLIVEFMRQGMNPQEACEQAMRRVEKKYPKLVEEGHQVGYLALRKDGAIGAYSLQEGYSYTTYQDGVSHQESPFSVAE